MFKLDTSGMETVLYSFSNSPDGASPGGLIMDTAGNLYGTTDIGGGAGFGTVFKLDTSGNETVLHGFTGSLGDGALPQFGLIMDKVGNLYGTTRDGGGLGKGTVFKLSLQPRFSGTITTGALVGNILTATLVLTNTGIDQANNISINSILLRVLDGSGAVTLNLKSEFH